MLLLPEIVQVVVDVAFVGFLRGDGGFLFYDHLLEYEALQGGLHILLGRDGVRGKFGGVGPNEIPECFVEVFPLEVFGFVEAGADVDRQRFFVRVASWHEVTK